ncbi:21 kDa seed protein-like [Durio zibethinus]|uniref:21 kDa seed protein-like n=1 Tax=Durio zibethinus TaxID=66656 RepID=A0A6P5Y1Q1_DURZI|nr:21 kDa seed protein-like [Durio zibethinus]
MKTTTVVVLLLFAFTTKSYFFGVADATNEPVLDTDGEELRAGVKYYVVSPITGAGGGGLALGRLTDKKCPEIVVQRRSDLENGTPVVFYNLDTNDDIVRLSTDLNVEFVPIRDRLCLTSTVWKIDDYDTSTGKWWVTTDGVKGNPGPHTLQSWFKIEKSGNFGYKFNFCPSVCESCITLCGDIGRYGHDGQIRLALAESGWPFVFQKASSTIKQVVNAKN